MDQVLDDQHDFKMKSPFQDLYAESALQQELVFSSPAGASLAAGPEVDDKEDVSDGELVTIFRYRAATGSGTESI